MLCCIYGIIFVKFYFEVLFQFLSLNYKFAYNNFATIFSVAISQSVSDVTEADIEPLHREP